METVGWIIFVGIHVFWAGWMLVKMKEGDKLDKLDAEVYRLERLHRIETLKK
mgnify:CR=1 FL=1